MSQAITPSRSRLWRLAIVTVLLPSAMATLDRLLLDGLAGTWASDWMMVLTMAVFVFQIGLMGFVCGRWIDWPAVRWILYGWCWLIVDLQVLLARQLAVENIFGGTAAFLTGSLLAAQLGLVTVWAVLGKMRWSTRWPAAFVLASILAMPLLELRYTGNATLFFVTQLFTIVGISSLLRWNGFVLTPASPQARAAVTQDRATALPISQFGLWNMLVWTTAMALVLALVRLVGLPWDEWASPRFLRSWLVFSTSGVAVGIVLAVAIWAALAPDRPVRRWSLVLLVTPAAALMSGIVEWTAWILDPWNWNRWGKFVRWFGQDFWQGYFDTERWLIAWICLAGAMLFAALLFLRANGYRLEATERERGG